MLDFLNKRLEELLGAFLLAVMACIAFINVIIRYCTNLSFAASFRQYLTFSTVLFNIAWLALNLLLIVSCAKNICPAGDEEVTPRRSRFEWINRMGDAYEESHTKLREQARHDGEELRRRHEERKHRKKKKK